MKARGKAAQIEALKQRLRDALIGANKHDEDDTQLSPKAICVLMRWVSRHIQVHSLAAADYSEFGHLLGWWNVDEYTSVDDAAEWLHQMGLRA